MTELELEEMLTHRWPLVMRRAMAGSDRWVQGFVKSIAKHGKRATWRPTPKQEQVMKRLVSELGTPIEEEPVLIER